MHKKRGDSVTKNGRPRKEIDQQMFERLCSIMCTLDEISGFFNCSEDTIERWCKRTYTETFAEVFKKKSANGRISLRRTQFKLAETNAGMAIFLGKNYLGQRDNHEVQVTDAPIINEDVWAQST